MEVTVDPPPSINDVVARFDAMDAAFTEFDVSRELNVARKLLENPTEAEVAGAWAAVLAFALARDPHYENPWNSYFGPMGSGTSEDGTITYFPDIAGTHAGTIAHWSHRGRTLVHPVLKARYADLAWEMSQAIGKQKRDPEDARVAIDAYLASVPLRTNSHESFQDTIRALDLASLLSDANRTKSARETLMHLHREAIKAGTHQWWFAIDRLIDDKKAGVTDAERSELVADLEALVVRYADEANPGWHDPNSARDAADRLIKHYERTQRPADIKRLHALVARAFEHAASLANAMLAATFLQTAMDRYRDAGMPEENRRVRILMQAKIGEANTAMVPIGTEIKIPFDDMDKFLDAIITDEIGTSFVKIAREFLLKRKTLEEAVQRTLKQSPLMAHIPQYIMADDYVAAKIGSVEEDPFGRLFHEAKFRFGFSAVWLHNAFVRLFEKHEVHPEHFVGWANRHALFDDMALLLEGVRAWHTGDFVKATHILIPQIEVALRSIADEAGIPVTKAHPKVSETSVAVGMGDLLYSSKVTDLLGPNITFHLQALLADPRGLNLRNEMAHGLLGPAAFDGHVARLLIHCLLVLGIWKEVAGKPQ